MLTRSSLTIQFHFRGNDVLCKYALELHTREDGHVENMLRYLGVPSVSIDHC